jgi:hypothetical protein
MRKRILGVNFVFNRYYLDSNKMCEQNAFWFSDGNLLCAVMHPCFVFDGNFCLTFRKKKLSLSGWYSLPI